MDFKKLNSYMITGSKNLECQCDADTVPNIGKCEHAWESAKDPSICHPWQIRAFTARTTNLSLVETCIIAADLTGDKSFVEDESGQPYFGTPMVFISYFWQAPFESLARAIERCYQVQQTRSQACFGALTPEECNNLNLIDWTHKKRIAQSVRLSVAEMDMLLSRSQTPNPMFWLDILACAQNRHTSEARNWNG